MAWVTVQIDGSDRKRESRVPLKSNACANGSDEEGDDMVSVEEMRAMLDESSMVDLSLCWVQPMIGIERSVKDSDRVRSAWVQQWLVQPVVVCVLVAGGG